MSQNKGKEAASKRGSYMRGVAVKWLRLHRPDVMEAIMRDAYKKYPLVGSRQEKILLSKDLMNLK